LVVRKALFADFLHGIWLCTKKHSSRQQIVTSAAGLLMLAFNGWCPNFGRNLPFLTNLAFAVTFGLIRLLQHVTLISTWGQIGTEKCLFIGVDECANIAEHIRTSQVDLREK
jgi:hypothetical protein